MRQHALRRPLLYAAVTATIAALSMVPAGPALAATGTSTITGHLTDAAGHPAAGAFVWAQTPDMSSSGSAITDADGAYSVPGLAAGDYRVSFRAADSTFTQWSHQKTSFSFADSITVGAGATVLVDEQLLATGAITGSLLNRDGTPAGGWVNVYTADNNNYIDSRGLNPSDGTFRLDLTPGAYKLEYHVNNLTQWNGGAKTAAAAPAIQVTAGGTVQVHDTVLPTGSIAGRLTHADGSPAAGVSVSVRTPDFGLSSYTTTDADGRYRVDNLLLDTYVVVFSGPHYLDQYAPGTLDPNAAGRFAVTDGGVTTVDEALMPTGTLRLRAHDATSGAPLSNFCMYDNTYTNLSGCAQGTELVLDDVPAAAYNLSVDIDDRQHFGVPHAPATVTAGQTTALDLPLRRGASMQATMVKRDGGAATDGCIQLARVDAQFSYTPYGFCSDWQSNPVTGSVVVGPLEPGTYQMFAQPRDTALGMQWFTTAGGTGDRDAATRFTVATGDALTLPTVRFDKAGTIQGTVTDAATGAPLPYTCVWVAALSSVFGASGDCPASAGADGTYTIPGVGPYAWPVEFARGGGYQWRWSGNAVDRCAADKITVKPGRTAKADIKLRTGGGTVTGAVRDASGHPADAMVTAFSAVTGEAVTFFGGRDTPEGQPPATYTVSNIAPQQVKLFWSTNDGRSGWVGGADLAHAQSFDVRNNRTLTVNITVA